MNLRCIEVVQAAGLRGETKQGREVLFLCPCHDDHSPSLTINPDKNAWLCGPCAKGGNAWALAAFILGVNPKDKDTVTAWLREKGLLDDKPRRQIVAEYDYRDENGKLLFQSVRYAPKDFKQRQPDGNRGWVWGLDGVRLVPYRLPEWKDKSTVYVAEGEKDVDNLWKLGFPATCNPMGAGKWRPDYDVHFHGKKVVILPDNDTPGEDHGHEVARHLFPVAVATKIINLPNLPPKGDVSDWIQAGGNKKELARIIENAPRLTRAEIDSWEDKSPTVKSLQPVSRDPQPWPVLAEEAFYGLAGDIVRIIEPHTEADPAALLVQLLAGIGIAIGRNPFFEAEADRHRMNLYAILVGRSSKSRKGTSWGYVSRLLSESEPDWNKLETSGLSSGEGLIWAVRDPIEKMEPIREGKTVKTYQSVITDHGVPDKRLLVQEAEFASTLRVLSREGNTLSAIIRDAWDKGTLRTKVKNSPAEATDTHIGIVAHITADELKQYLSRTEAGNGFANRFLFICVSRSKSLPEGGNLNPHDLVPLRERLAKALAFAKTTGQMRRDEDARKIWCAVYDDLAEGRLGLFGAITARAEAQVLRLSCLYALLDESSIVRRPHLLAALALWDYALDSARFIFGDALGDSTADEILTALRSNPAGMTRTEIRDFFGRNRRADEISRALTLLAEHGMASFQKESDTGGRSLERWHATARGTTFTTEATKVGHLVVNVVGRS
jgi:hypothetical protein